MGLEEMRAVVNNSGMVLETDDYYPLGEPLSILHTETCIKSIRINNHHRHIRDLTFFR